jgi:hypothetical protein
LNEHITLSVKDPFSQNVFINEWINLTGERKSYYLQARAIYEEQFEEFIQEAMDAGLIRKGNSRMTFLFMINSVNWLHRLFESKKDNFKVRELRKELITYIVRGLRPIQTKS